MRTLWLGEVLNCLQDHMMGSVTQALDLKSTLSCLLRGQSNIDRMREVAEKDFSSDLGGGGRRVKLSSTLAFCSFLKDKAECA